MTTWLLISDAGRARLFSTELPDDEWSLVQAFDHPESREPSRTARTTEPYGRARQGTGWRGVQSAFEPHTPPDDVENARFAAELADCLEHGIATRKFDVLVLAAPPRFLGVLQGHLSDQVIARVRAAVDKDLTKLSPADLRDRLLPVAFPSRPASTNS